MEGIIQHNPELQSEAEVQSGTIYLANGTFKLMDRRQRVFSSRHNDRAAMPNDEQIKVISNYDR